MGDRALFVLALRAGDVLRDREVERMIPSNNISRVYDPHTLSIMAIAFDRACDFLPVQFRNSDYMRRKVASHIIRHVNDGESDPTRLDDSAIVSIFCQSNRLVVCAPSTTSLRSRLRPCAKAPRCPARTGTC